MSGAMRRMGVLLPLLLLTGCGGWQSILDPRNPGAARIEWFWWFALASTGVLSIAVIAWLLLAIRRARGAAPGGDPRQVPEGESRFILLVGGGGPMLFLVGFLTVSVFTGTAVSDPPSGPAFTVEVVGHRFWWEVRYEEEEIVTANEIHIPAGTPVQFRVSSADVIHSFWVPKIQPGKIDMTPGRTTFTWLYAEEPGVYRGQCTEFCGIQHAHMAMVVIASEEEEFRSWLERRRRPPPEPTDARELEGRRTFFAAGCASCHAIEGVSRPTFAGNPGPDLTHLASRETLGALTIPNDREHLGRWIRDPHQFKPGVRMPPTALADDVLEPLLDYLETLR